MRADTVSVRKYLSPEQIEIIKKKTEGKCKYCGKEAPRFTIDHFIPTAKGGTDDISNLVIACGSCNSAKSGTTPEYFHKYRALREIGAPSNLPVSAMDWLIEKGLTSFRWPDYPW